MTLLEQLQAHKGGLIQLKTQLYWYDGRGYDGTSGRICLILDATASDAADGVGPVAYAGRATNPAGNVYAAAAAFLLIDGQPQWIWVAKEGVELLVNDPPAN